MPSFGFARRSKKLLHIKEERRLVVFDKPEIISSFGDVARLVGVDPPPTQVPAGQPIPLTLYWQAH
ncbi:hypothetical protein [Candidatus Leptofilum sp.]|uniref:hypothetical protein n=1 Tax=Candidatus Leptofilum sp. TaxID=3241576 RepID=UPI003B5A2CBF